MFKWKRIGVDKSGKLKPKLSVSMVLGYTCLAVAILAMAFLGVGSSGGSKGPLSGAAAKVNGVEISMQDFIRSYESYRNIYQRFGIPASNLANIVINNLIQQELNHQLIALAGVYVLDSEVDDEVTKDLKRRYDSTPLNEIVDALKKRGETEAVLRKATADELLQDKYNKILEELTYISEDSLKDSYFLANTKFDVSYIKLTKENISVKVSNSDINSYIEKEENKSKIKGYYDRNESSYNIPKKVSVRQILVTHKDSKLDPLSSKLDLDSSKDEGGKSSLTKEAAKRKATNILNNIQKDKNIDFAKLAKEKSKDKSLISGNLGFVKKEELPASVADKAFSMEVGQISDIIESDEGFHIIKVEAIQDKIEKPLSEVQSEIAKILIEQERIPELLKQKANEILALVKEGKALPKSKDKAIEWKDTGEFKMDSKSIPTLDESDKLKEAIFSLSKKSEVYKEPVEDGNSYYILKLKSKTVPTEEQYNKDKQSFLSQMTKEKKDYIQSVIVEQYNEKNKKNIWKNPKYLALDKRMEQGEEE